MNMLRSPIQVTPLAVDRAAVDRHVFAKDVAVADSQRRRLAPVAAVLRALAEHGPVADEVLRPHRERPAQAGVAFDHALRSDLDRTLDNRVRADLNVGCQRSLRGR